MVFEYDPNKNKENIKKHGVDFEEAISVFADPFLAISRDSSQPREERFIALGNSLKNQSLFVVHCYRSRNHEKEEIVRIISARKITKAETKRLEKL